MASTIAIPTSKGVIANYWVQSKITVYVEDLKVEIQYKGYVDQAGYESKMDFLEERIVYVDIDPQSPDAQAGFAMANAAGEPALKKAYGIEDVGA